MTIKKVLAELREVNGVINDAYWRFSRQARGIPPVMAVPEAYERRAQLEADLRLLQLREGIRVLQREGRS